MLSPISHCSHQVTVEIWLLQQVPPSPSLPISILVLLFLLANSILAVLSVLFPERVVQVHARFSRFFYEVTTGPDWEEFLERQGRLKFLEYLRRAPREPQAFSGQVVVFRLFSIFYGIVAFFLLVVWCYVLFQGE